MARSLLSVQNISRTGLNPTFSAADTNGMSFDNTSQKVALHVKNASGSSINVTIITTAQADGLDVADRIVAVPNTEERIMGPFPKNWYNGACVDTTLSQAVKIDFSSVTSVTVAAFKLPDPTF